MRVNLFGVSKDAIPKRLSLMDKSCSHAPELEYAVHFPNRDVADDDAFAHLQRCEIEINRELSYF